MFENIVIGVVCFLAGYLLCSLTSLKVERKIDAALKAAKDAK